MTGWFAAVFALCAACNRQPDAGASAGSSAGSGGAAAIAASEIKRGQDACTAYVDKVCACAQTVPAMQEPCKLARALPDALRTSAEVARSADSARLDVVQGNLGVRGIAKECIEQLAKLPAAGCP
jgi:hypothetical protein